MDAHQRDLLTKEIIDLLERMATTGISIIDTNNITDDQKKQYRRLVEDAAEKALTQSNLTGDEIQQIIEKSDIVECEIVRILIVFLREIIEIITEKREKYEEEPSTISPNKEDEEIPF